ncbi:MAG: metal-dependent transcriptional regulator [Thermoplasmatota archaeon]
MARGGRTGEAVSDELLFFEEEHDHSEEYLEALVMLEQDGKKPATVTQVAQMLRIKPPSAVEMLKRLAKRGVVTYLDRQGVRLTPKGRRIGRRMVRNGRLMEVFLVQDLRIPLDIRLAHTVEHSMTEVFADALCTRLGHPASCPHGYPIPQGRCCRDAPQASVSASSPG